ncbi:MAG: hypothetical protein JNM94_18855 [Phycisphaerae bacterium]|nr:hypothetical protein [Phycisphaerae bacterium]
MDRDPTPPTPTLESPDYACATCGYLCVTRAEVCPECGGRSIVARQRRGLPSRATYVLLAFALATFACAAVAFVLQMTILSIVGGVVAVFCTSFATRYQNNLNSKALLALVVAWIAMAIGLVGLMYRSQELVGLGITFLTPIQAALVVWHMQESRRRDHALVAHLVGFLVLLALPLQVGLGVILVGGQQIISALPVGATWDVIALVVGVPAFVVAMIGSSIAAALEAVARREGPSVTLRRPRG